MPGGNGWQHFPGIGSLRRLRRRVPGGLILNNTLALLAHLLGKGSGTWFREASFRATLQHFRPICSEKVPAQGSGRLDFEQHSSTLGPFAWKRVRHRVLGGLISSNPPTLWALTVGSGPTLPYFSLLDIVHPWMPTLGVNTWMDWIDGYLDVSDG